MRLFPTTSTLRGPAFLAVVLTMAATACGSESGSTADDSRPTVVVTTNILGDVVRSATGGLVDVEVIMPIGSEPHDFAPSARQAEAMENADLLVINGAGFEGAMTGIIDSVEASGTPLFSFADEVPLLDADPHLWTDPSRVATGLDALEPRVAALDGVDADALAESVADYTDQLADLDASIEAAVSEIPADERVLVTNHEVFGYFADRFGFEVVGAVIPSLTTDAEPSAADLEALTDVMRNENVQVIFGETTESLQIAEALAAELGGDVEIVELFSESLGAEGSGAETYLTMMSTNTDLIATALTS